MLALLLKPAFRAFLLGMAVWLGIAASRARGTPAEALAWSGVLMASLAMPLLMRLTGIAFVIPAPFSAIGSVFHLSPLAGLLAVWLGINLLRARNHGEALAWAALLAASFAMQLAAQYLAIAEVVLPAPASGAGNSARAASLLSYGPGLLTALYVGVALAMLLRLAAALFATWQLYRHARPLQAAWTEGRAVRVSRAIAMPGTFGSTILLPRDHVAWSAAKRSAVIAHESAHVRRRDFYWQLLAAVHRCLFWFSPLAWFLEARLAHLAELASDDAAIGVIGDRPQYADLLFEFAAKDLPATAIAMARAEKILERVERILAPPVSTALTGRKRFLAYACLALLVAGAAELSPAAQARSPAAPHITAHTAFVPIGNHAALRR